MVWRRKCIFWSEVNMETDYSAPYTTWPGWQRYSNPVKLCVRWVNWNITDNSSSCHSNFSNKSTERSKCLRLLDCLTPSVTAAFKNPWNLTWRYLRSRQNRQRQDRMCNGFRNCSFFVMLHFSSETMEVVVAYISYNEKPGLYTKTLTSQMRP